MSTSQSARLSLPPETATSTRSSRVNMRSRAIERSTFRWKKKTKQVLQKAALWLRSWTVAFSAQRRHFTARLRR